MFAKKQMAAAAVLCLLISTSACSKQNSNTSSEPETQPSATTDTVQMDKTNETKETTPSEEETVIMETETQSPEENLTMMLTHDNERLQGIWKNEENSTYKVFNGLREYEIIGDLDEIKETVPSHQQSIQLGNYTITPISGKKGVYLMQKDETQYLLTHYNEQALYYDFATLADDNCDIWSDEYNGADMINQYHTYVSIEDENTLSFYDDIGDENTTVFHKTDEFDDLLPYLSTGADFFDYDTDFEITEKNLPGVYYRKQDSLNLDYMPVYVFLEDGSALSMTYRIHNSGYKSPAIGETEELFQDENLHIWKIKNETPVEVFFAETNGFLYEMSLSSSQPTDTKYHLNGSNLTMTHGNNIEDFNINIDGCNLFCKAVTENSNDMTLIRLNTVSKLLPYLQ